jgi:hypothetical protein
VLVTIAHSVPTVPPTPSRQPSRDHSTSSHSAVEQRLQPLGVHEQREGDYPVYLNHGNLLPPRGLQLRIPVNPHSQHGDPARRADLDDDLQRSLTKVASLGGVNDDAGRGEGGSNAR